MNRKKIKHIDFFSGIGGFSLAAQRVWGEQWECVGHSEIDKYACQVYHHHFPNSPCLGDINNIGDVDADLITAGFPCQDLSIAGKRLGLAGNNRSGLFWKLAEHIEKVKPRWIVLENVPGLLSSNGGKDMWEVVNKLDKIGYCVAWRVLDAQYFGVAQRRRRVWIVGSLGNTCATEVLFNRESSYWFNTKNNKKETIGLCITTRDGYRNNPTSETHIANTITTQDIWRGNYITQTDTNGKREVDGIPRGMDIVRGKMLGNAIVPRVAEKIFRNIRKVDELIVE